MNQEKIGEFIKTKRKEKNLTQQELGDLVGVGFKAVSKWECGNSVPNISIMKKLCEILDVSIEELLDGKDNKFIENKKKKNTYIYLVAIIIITILAGGVTSFLINRSKTNSNKINEYECTMTKTYNIINISDSNDSNYLYVTFKEYQSEGIYSIKLSKTISKDLEINKSYEFTFNIDKKNIYEDPQTIFQNSELINITLSEKTGNDQKSEFNCK